MPITPPVAGALIGAGSSLLGSVFGSSSSRANYHRNKKLARYQHDLNMEGWREQNAYNTPAMQMQRYREAGLNPHMVAGSGTSGNAESTPQYQAPSGNIENHFPKDLFQNALGTYFDIKTKDSQNKILQEQIRSARAQADVDEIQAATQGMDYRQRKEHDKDYRDPYGGKALSKYSQDYKGRELDNMIKALTFDIKKYDLDDKPNQMKFNQKEQEAKIKAMGLENRFKQYRNELAADGLTFTSNEWAVLINRIINYVSENYGKKK